MGENHRFLYPSISVNSYQYVNVCAFVRFKQLKKLNYFYKSLNIYPKIRKNEHKTKKNLYNVSYKLNVINYAKQYGNTAAFWSATDRRNGS